MAGLLTLARQAPPRPRAPHATRPSARPSGAAGQHATRAPPGPPRCGRGEHASPECSGPIGEHAIAPSAGPSRYGRGKDIGASSAGHSGPGGEHVGELHGAAAFASSSGRRGGMGPAASSEAKQGRHGGRERERTGWRG
ncbi:translation initiation factor IF-2-like [Panicum virgatum]|nr:translation initiation factor IF-2-like [Panicum virgatum]